MLIAELYKLSPNQLKAPKTHPLGTPQLFKFFSNP